MVHSRELLGGADQGGPKGHLWNPSERIARTLYCCFLRGFGFCFLKKEWNRTPSVIIFRSKAELL